MSEELTFWQKYNKAVRKLDNRQLGEALEFLQDMANETGDWHLLDEVSNVSSAYGLLLYYMEQGNNDPARERQHTNFIANCYRIADKAAQIMRHSHMSTDYSMRDVSEILKDLENLGLRNITSGFDDNDEQNHVKLYTELFNASYDSPLWSDDNATKAQAVIDSALVSDNDKSVMISGLFIGCMLSFDARKVMFFADNYPTASGMLLRTRLVIAIALILYTYRKRMFAFPFISDRIRMLSENKRFVSDMILLQILLIESLSTQEVNRKLREEIIPAMMKSHNFNPNKFGIETIDEIIDSNPEWKKFEQQVGKLAELEAGGADIYYSSFSALKRYPFFGSAANWFYPFDISHPLIPVRIREAGAKGVAGILLNGGMLCDSDKYSFCLLTSHMTDEQAKMLISQLPDAAGLDIHAEKTYESECRNCLRNIYRFFYLFNGATKPANPFEENIILIDCDVFTEVFSSKSQIDKTSAFALKKEKYDIALPYLRKSIASGNADAETFQKAGFCYQKKKMFPEAINAYENAYALNGDSQWTLQHLAQTNRIAGNYKEALDYYRLLDADGDNKAKNAFRRGECLAHLEKYEEARREFFHAEYIDPSMTAAVRAAAWCSVLIDDLEKARKYYDKILEKSEQGNDFICAGHAAWMDRDIKAAVGFYVHAYKIMPHEDFRQQFCADREILKTHGISDYDITLMYDLVARKQSE